MPTSHIPPSEWRAPEKEEKKKNLPENMVFSLFFHLLLSNKAFMGNQENT